MGGSILPMTPVSNTLARTLSYARIVDSVADSRVSPALAASLVAARQSGRALRTFPGPLPADARTAYACQDEAIGLWRDAIAGWKVGLVAPELARAWGEDRVTGPIFARSVRRTSAAPTPFPVFLGGFAAIEAEFVLVLGRDAPANKTEWTVAEARDMVQAVHIGIETAGSPLATINDLGPAAIVADFGNNAGLILGPELPDWRLQPLDAWRCESFVDGASVGRGHAGLLPGGVFESLRFLLVRNARRARPLCAHDLISAGAVTGVHAITAGQSARVEFAGAGEIHCVAHAFVRAAVHAAGAPQ
jgi:2-keto-4-pentenoate hydratase